MDDFAYFHGTDVAMLIPVALFMMLWACGIVAIDYWVSARRDLNCGTAAKAADDVRTATAPRVAVERSAVPLASPYSMRSIAGTALRCDASRPG
jgi:hypothetical protein